MGMTVELRAELIGLFAEVLDADEHSIDLPDATRAVGGCSRLQSVLAARHATLAPVLRQLELRAAQTRPTDGDATGDGHDDGAAGPGVDDDSLGDGDDASAAGPGVDEGCLPVDAPGSVPDAVVPRVSVREQRRRDLRAKWLDFFGGFAAELQAGRISTDHADALAAVCERLEPWVLAELHDLEGHLLTYARTLGPEALTSELVNRVEGIRDDRGHSLYQHQLAESRAWLRLDRTTGMYQLHAYLDPIRGEALQSVLDQYIDRLRRDPAHEHTPFDKLMVQAVVDLVVHDIAITPKVLVVVDEHSARTGVQHGFTVCENIDGARLPLDHALAACAINANVTAAIIDRAGQPADLTTRDRCATDPQKLDLRSLDRECVFPGCDTPFSRLHMHHVVYHHDGGPTAVSNMVPICNSHHHDIHDRGWHLTIDHQRTITITRPDHTTHAVIHPTRLDGQPTPHPGTGAGQGGSTASAGAATGITETATESPPGRASEPPRPFGGPPGPDADGRPQDATAHPAATGPPAARTHRPAA